MIDFRYHALSLVAVFLALGIGIVLGVTVGDSLVSDADRNLRDSLRGDVEEVREQARDEAALGEKREQVIEDTAPAVAAGRLSGRRVALVALGELPETIADSVDEAVKVGGGRLMRTAVLAESEDGLARRPRRRGRRIGRLVATGGPAATRLRRLDPSRFSGRYAAPVDAVVLYRHAPPEPAGDEEAEALDAREAFEEGLLSGLPEDVIGVEALDSDPSQVSWYEDEAAASVDNVDVAAGRLAIVLLLEDATAFGGDGPEGSFGYKDSADRAIPELQESAAGASP